MQRTCISGASRRYVDAVSALFAVRDACTGGKCSPKWGRMQWPGEAEAGGKEKTGVAKKR